MPRPFLWLMNRRSLFRYPTSIARCIRIRIRTLTTLAIETSCDDTSVAILEKHQNNSATLLFHDKITSNNVMYGGIHPLVAHESHQKTLAGLVYRAIAAADGLRDGWKPDFITVTRGPGMRPSLTTGLDTAKGLAVAWNIPLLGVNHMQAHALTPRLVSALDAAETPSNLKRTDEPSFPFLTLLVSGGHTMLVHSRSLCNHEILASTTDLAIGDAIDKCARDILPSSYLESATNVMYGRLLEEFAFPNEEKEHNYIPPTSFNRPREVEGYNWFITPPYPSPGPRGPIAWAGMFTYSGIGSTVKRIITRELELDEAGRRILAREAMAVAFEHLASRVLFALDREDVSGVKSLVVSGGVASNQFLKVVLRTILDAKGHQGTELVFPPPKYCTDNAAMIAWAGMEMYEAGFRTSLSATAIRKWSIDPRADDGGILGVEGWMDWE